MVSDCMDAKTTAVIAFAVPAAAVALLSLTGADTGTMIFNVIAMFTCVPLMVFGMYIWATGCGYKWISGVDWTAMDADAASRCASYLGRYVAGASVLLLIGLSASMLSWFIISVVLFIAIILYPYIVIYRKGPAGVPALPSLTDAKAYGAMLLVVAIAVVPGMVLLNAGGDGNAVSVVFGEESVHIKAPMFDHVFAYSEIDDCVLDPDFDKGMRIMGYGTSTISSGRFHNTALGDYELASYTKVAPCIVLTVGLEYYAFNQSDAVSTQDAYGELRSHIPVV